jgi:hypothetical protein
VIGVGVGRGEASNGPCRAGGRALEVPGARGRARWRAAPRLPTRPPRGLLAPRAVPRAGAVRGPPHRRRALASGRRAGACAREGPGVPPRRRRRRPWGSPHNARQRSARPEAAGGHYRAWPFPVAAPRRCRRRRGGLGWGARRRGPGPMRRPAAPASVPRGPGSRQVALHLHTRLPAPKMTPPARRDALGRVPTTGGAAAARASAIEGQRRSHAAAAQRQAGAWPNAAPPAPPAPPAPRTPPTPPAPPTPPHTQRPGARPARATARPGARRRHGRARAAQRCPGRRVRGAPPSTRCCAARRCCCRPLLPCTRPAARWCRLSRSTFSPLWPGWHPACR